MEINNKLNVELLHHTPLKIADIGVGTCWDKHSDQSETNTGRLDRVINKFKHASTSEHLYYNFYIKNISRALLQELARHRIASPSVKSTRYTLKELKDIQEPFCTYELSPNKHLIINVTEEQFKRASKFLVFTGINTTDKRSVSALEQLREEIRLNTSNDKAKYCLPDSYKTELTWSINARSLKNFIGLRTDKSALWEIRELAYEIFNILPEDHKFLFEQAVYTEEELEGEKDD